MAKASLVPAEPVKQDVLLTLSMDEACTLRTLLNAHVTGAGPHRLRLDHIESALCGAGLTYWTLDEMPVDVDNYVVRLLEA